MIFEVKFDFKKKKNQIFIPADLQMQEYLCCRVCNGNFLICVSFLPDTVLFGFPVARGKGLEKR